MYSTITFLWGLWGVCACVGMVELRTKEERTKTYLGAASLDARSNMAKWATPIIERAPKLAMPDVMPGGPDYGLGGA